MGRVLGILSAAILVLSACGGGASTSTATAAAVAGGGKDVVIQGFALNPKSIEVSVGTKVTWTNKDGTSHTTTSGTPSAKDGKWDGPLPGSGGTFSFTFAQAGTFAYFCTVHPTTSALAGTVVVK